MEHPLVRGIIFDLDDTLYPREHWVRSGCVAVARYLAATFECSQVEMLHALTQASTTHPGREIEATCRAYGWPPETVDELVTVMRRHEPQLTLPPVTVAVLRSLRSEGWRLGILTNGPAAVQARKVTALGVREYVDAVVYAEEHAPGGKPARAPFAAVLAAIGVPAERAVHVGDDPIADIEGGRAAGLGTIRIRRASRSGPAPDADLVVDHLEEVPAAAHRVLTEMAVHAA